MLLSGGLDSAVNLYKANQETKVILALTFDYGQKAVKKEILSAQKLCEKLNIPHKVLAISWLKDLGQSSLTDPSRTIPTADSVKIDNYENSLRTAASVWVPNRNGVLLNIAAAYAESMGAKKLIPGFNKEEAQTFPDNTEDYLKSLTNSFFYSTSNKVEAYCFTTNLNKAEIVEMGMILSLPFELLWPCYQDLEKWCGRCESCLRFKRALQANNLISLYQEYFE